MYICHCINNEIYFCLPECFCIFCNIIEGNAETQNFVVLENNILYPIKVTQVEQHVKCNTNEGFDLDHLKRKATMEGIVPEKSFNF